MDGSLCKRDTMVSRLHGEPVFSPYTAIFYADVLQFLFRMFIFSQFSRDLLNMNAFESYVEQKADFLILLAKWACHKMGP